MYSRATMQKLTSLTVYLLRNHGGNVGARQDKRTLRQVIAEGVEVNAPHVTYGAEASLHSQQSNSQKCHTCCKARQGWHPAELAINNCIVFCILPGGSMYNQRCRAG